MNRNQKLVHIYFLLAGLLSFPVVAQAQYTFTTNSDGSLNISAFSGGGAVTIPDTSSNVPITSIGYSAFHLNALTSVTKGSNLTSIGIEAFMSCNLLKSVTLGSNLTSIGNAAFDNCAFLRSITVPDSVTNFGSDVFMACPKLTNAILGNGIMSLPDYTFNSCTSLTNLVIGRSVASIGNAVFTQCPLQAITVNAQNQFFCSVNEVLYDKNQTKLILYPYGRGGSSYTIPDSVMVIGQDAFYNCTGFTNIIIPNHVTDLQQSAFLDCSGLANVTIGSSVTNIETAAFRRLQQPDERDHPRQRHEHRAIRILQLHQPDQRPDWKRNYHDCRRRISELLEPAERLFRGQRAKLVGILLRRWQCDRLLFAGDRGLEFQIWRSLWSAHSAMVPAPPGHFKF